MASGARGLPALRCAKPSMPGIFSQVSAPAKSNLKRIPMTPAKGSPSIRPSRNSWSRSRQPTAHAPTGSTGIPSIFVYEVGSVSRVGAIACAVPPVVEGRKMAQDKRSAILGTCARPADQPRRGGAILSQFLMRRSCDFPARRCPMESKHAAILFRTCTAAPTASAAAPWRSPHGQTSRWRCCRQLRPDRKTGCG